jgi:hypothetical protein
VTAKADGAAVGDVGRIALDAEPSVRRFIFFHPLLIIATAVWLFLAYMAMLSQAFTFDWYLHRPPVIEMPYGLDPNTPGCASGFGRE